MRKRVHTAEVQPFTGVRTHLCELADGGEAMGQRLVGGEAVTLHGVGGLRGAVAWRQVRRRGSRQTSRVEHGLRLRTGLTRLRRRTRHVEVHYDLHLQTLMCRAFNKCRHFYLSVSWTGRRVLGWGLIPGGGAGGLRMMDGARVVRERLS